MTLHKNEKGLTLIELLITIAVIAIVAAISIPVITNVIDSARTSSAASMEAQVNAFVEKYAASGKVTFDGIDTFTGWVDLNANGQVDENEDIETFKVDTTQFSIATNLSNNKSEPKVDESYTDEDNFPGLPSEISITAGGAEGGAEQAATAAYSLNGLSPITKIADLSSQEGGLNNVIDSATFTTVIEYNNEFSSSWSTDFPVLAVNQPGSNYAFVPLRAARYGLDYYDNAERNNPNAVDNVYHVAVGSSPNMNEGSQSFLIYYDSDPTSGPANKLEIDWVGFAQGEPIGGK